MVFIPQIISLRGSQLTVTYSFSTGMGNNTASELVGDFNEDTVVNFADFVVFAEGYALPYTDLKYNARLDLNGDGPVDFSDFLIFVSHFEQSK